MAFRASGMPVECSTELCHKNTAEFLNARVVEKVLVFRGLPLKNECLIFDITSLLSNFSTRFFNLVVLDSG